MNKRPYTRNRWWIARVLIAAIGIGICASLSSGVGAVEDEFGLPMSTLQPLLDFNHGTEVQRYDDQLQSVSAPVWSSSSMPDREYPSAAAEFPTIMSPPIRSESSAKSWKSVRRMQAVQNSAPQISAEAPQSSRGISFTLPRLPKLRRKRNSRQVGSVGPVGPVGEVFGVPQQTRFVSSAEVPGERIEQSTGPFDMPPSTSVNTLDGAAWRDERPQGIRVAQNTPAVGSESEVGIAEEIPAPEVAAADESKEDLPFMSPTVNGNYCVNGLDATPITKRLFGIEVPDDEDLSPTTRVDLSYPIDLPHYDHRAGRVDYHESDFGPLHEMPYQGYDGQLESIPYYGKTPVRAERPWIELGRGQYLAGPVPYSPTWLGETNPLSPRFLLYGDLRTAVAFNDNGGNSEFVNAYRLNLDLDLQITATERIHAFIGPLDRGGNFTRFSSNNNDNLEFFEEFDQDFDTLFFEGDLGAMLGGALNIYPPFDMPIALGLMPMLYQNGNWILDNFLGAAVTIPARHNAKLMWSNYDVTFFAGIDEINSPAFPGDDSQASIYGVHANIEAYTGYLEVGYAFLNDELDQGLSYHNLGVSFTRRYFQRLSNSIRLISNIGQNPVAGRQTADGHLVLLENSWITSDYTHIVPYLNLFAGFDRPQSVARAGGVGGVLLNTGINFETDGLTGFPTLDATANNTFGGAVGLNLLGPDFSWQVVTEFAVVATHGNRADRIAPGNQYGFGVRVQKPITNAWLTRFDTMYGLRDEQDDLFGMRFELRYKF